MKKPKLRAQLFGSGSILREALQAQDILGEKYGVAADVWSVTSYKALYNDGIETERWNRLHPSAKQQRVPYVTQATGKRTGRAGRGFGLSQDAAQYDQPVDAAAAWHRSVPMDSAAAKAESLCATSLKSMRGRIVLATLHELHHDGKIERKVVDKAIKELGIDPDKPNPVVS